MYRSFVSLGRYTPKYFILFGVLFFFCFFYVDACSCKGSLGSSEVKNPPTNAEDIGLIPRSGRSLGERNGNPLQYFCLENPMDRVAGGSMGLPRVRHDLATKQ